MTAPALPDAAPDLTVYDKVQAEEIQTAIDKLNELRLVVQYLLENPTPDAYDALVASANAAQLAATAAAASAAASAAAVEAGAGSVDATQLTAALLEQREGLSGVNRSGTWNGTTYVMPVRQPGDVLIYPGPVSPVSLGFVLEFNDEWHDTSASV